MPAQTHKDLAQDLLEAELQRLGHPDFSYILCFSDEGPDTGPHPVRQEDLRAAFRPDHGWRILAIEPERVETRFHDSGAPAWLARIERI